MDVVSVLPDFLDALFGRADVEEGLPLEMHIPRAKLDFSPDSLHALDGYLEHLHRVADTLPEPQITNIAMAAGAYLGEVIRRHSIDKFSWQNHGDYFSSHPQSAALFPFVPGTSALLVRSSGGMTLPINKILRFIYDGPENNTHYYASLEIRPSPRN